MKRPGSAPPIELIPISEIANESKVGKKDVEILKREIEKYGQLVAVIVSVAPEGYILEAGAKRLEAAKAAGWKEIKATIISNKDGDDDYDSTTIREWVKLIESHQRYEMSDYDLAKAAVQMEDKHQIKGSEFARQMGLSNGYTYNLMRWYRMAPEKVREAWKAGNPLINQAELERYSHMAKADTIEAWDLRLRMRASAFEPFMPGGKKQNGNGPHASMSKHKPRRASERQISQLQQAIDDSVLTEPVKQLCGNMLKFVLGVEKNVPGITDYQKLPLTIISKDALKEKERSAS
jgi:ParB/RepB/Spo0J family partition protein